MYMGTEKQVCKNQVSELRVKVDPCSKKCLSAIICHNCEKSGTDSLMYKMPLVHLCIKPRQTCQYLGFVSYIFSIESPLCVFILT